MEPGYVGSHQDLLSVDDLKLSVGGPVNDRLRGQFYRGFGRLNGVRLVNQKCQSDQLFERYRFNGDGEPFLGTVWKHARSHRACTVRCRITTCKHALGVLIPAYVGSDQMMLWCSAERRSIALSLPALLPAPQAVRARFEAYS